MSKLRFRLGGRQRVKVITGAERARRLAEVLVRWQAARRGELALARLSREAARKIRESKRRLEPLLDGRPFHFHGLTIRTAAVPKIGRNRE
ncbi:MAG TPA: hypothetical protein VGH32_14225 [Pirellulales bacterium]